MSEPLEQKLVLRELDDNAAWMRAIFQHYLSWYTFFITANLFVLSWIFNKTPGRGTLPLSAIFIFLNICGAITATLLSRYIATADQRNRILVERLNALAELEGPLVMRPTFPRSLARIGFIFIALGLVGIAVLWVVAAVLF